MLDSECTYVYCEGDVLRLPEAQRGITKNLGSFDEYLTKCIEAAVLKIKQNEPYITLPESALIEGEAER